MTAQTVDPSTGAVLVLGMHRGGTSAVAGLLHLLGFDFGPELMPAAAGVNNKGFWEHIEAFKIHERLLAALGRSRFDPREMPVGWLGHPAFRVAVDEVRALIERDFRGCARWAVKDPRMCRLVPVWLTALAEAGIRPRVILVVRHPLEVARSMHAQGWVSSNARAHLCWLQHMLEAERATRDVSRTLVRYDALLADWRIEATRIGADLALDWTGAQAQPDVEIDAFVDTRERHYVEAGPSQELPPLASEVFAACADPTSAWTRLAVLDETYLQGAAAWAPCLDEAIVEATLARLEISQSRTEAEAQSPIDVIELRCRAQAQAYPAQAAVVHRHDTRRRRATLQFDLPLGERIDFLRVDFGAVPGVFRLAQLSIDDAQVTGLGARASGPRDAAVLCRVSGDDTLQVVGLRGDAWIEIDVRGLTPEPNADAARLRVRVDIERETGTAELTAIVAAIDDDRETMAADAARHAAAHIDALAAATHDVAERARAHDENLSRTAAGLAAVKVEFEREQTERRESSRAQADALAVLMQKIDELVASDARRFRWRPLWRARSRD